MEMHHTQAYCLSYIGHISQAGHFIYMASAENLIAQQDRAVRELQDAA